MNVASGSPSTLARVVNGDDAQQQPGYPGAGLGMPPTGPGSMSRLGPRVIAVLIDWLLCSVIAAGLLGYHFDGTGNRWAPLLVFFVENVALVGTLGSTVGHRVMGLRISRASGAAAGPVPALVRSFLLCLFIPAVIWDKDGRGMHDRLAGTVIRRTR